MKKTITRQAEARWESSCEEGQGSVLATSDAIPETPFSLSDRLNPSANGSHGTSPEELVAASAAACFSLALSKTLSENHTPPDEIITQSDVTITHASDGIHMDRLRIFANGVVPGITPEEFAKAIQETKHHSAIYRLISPGFAKAIVDGRLIAT